MARRGSNEWRDRVREGSRRGRAAAHARRQYLHKVGPRDLPRLLASGTVSESLRPLLRIATEEQATLIEDLGGIDAVTEARRVLVEMAVGVGIVHRAELARFLQTGDGEAGSRATSAANSIRTTLSTLGLERRAREINLREYVDARAHEAEQKGTGGTNGSGSDSLSRVKENASRRGSLPDRRYRESTQTERREI